MWGASNTASVRDLHRVTHSVFERAVAEAPLPILIVDALGHEHAVVHTNAAFADLTGYQPQEILGADWTRLGIQDAGANSPDELRAALQDERPTRATLLLRSKRGASVWTDIQLSSIHDESGVVTHRLVMFRDLTEERRFREELEHSAHHDVLTGLPNRRLFQTRLERALSKSRLEGGAFTIILLDLNSFKLVNDCFGHDAGDELLKCVGQRLKGCVRVDDTVARLGGDEFVLLLESGSTAPEVIISRITESLRHPILLDGRIVAASCSSGIGRYPLDGRDASALLKAADRNLYRAKAQLGPRRAPSTLAIVGS